MITGTGRDWVSAGVLLGLAGTTFAVGVPAVNAWFAPANRGMALGIFGIGTGGTAIASFSTLPLTDAFGPFAPFATASAALVVVAVLSWILLSDPADRAIPLGTIAFLGLAAVLGAGAGAVFALVARLAPAEEVGAVTGQVDAAGGFFPPLVMGAIYGTAGDYTWGFVLLALTFAAVREEASAGNRGR
ncbi:hypothetical protein MOQ72_09885 [Saccharopolyspora sp. K220]|uniref:hypothetical protein n=1 Tax=Saccharopolyspora soli TaxID=2926618 RepID=UPI001F5A296C|nr:hypothetical protein [Saccharopolyspora soli]MCI2417735.1 hypothetical protein [Saccharopolyspora soli]